MPHRRSRTRPSRDRRHPLRGDGQAGGRRDPGHRRRQEAEGEHRQRALSLHRCGAGRQDERRQVPEVSPARHARAKARASRNRRLPRMSFPGRSAAPPGNDAARPAAGRTDHDRPDPPPLPARHRQELRPVVAVREVDLDIFPGEVVALCGDNGAGKSSLIKVISGPRSRRPARSACAASPSPSPPPTMRWSTASPELYQDLALAPRLSVERSLMMGSGLTRPCAAALPAHPRQEADDRGIPALSVAALRRRHRHDAPGRAALGRAAPGGGDLAGTALERRDHHHGRADGGSRGQRSALVLDLIRKLKPTGALSS